MSEFSGVQHRVSEECRPTRFSRASCQCRSRRPCLEMIKVLHRLYRCLLVHAARGPVCLPLRPHFDWLTSIRRMFRNAYIINLSIFVVQISVVNIIPIVLKNIALSFHSANTCIPAVRTDFALQRFSSLKVYTWISRNLTHAASISDLSAGLYLAAS